VTFQTANQTPHPDDLRASAAKIESLIAECTGHPVPSEIRIRLWSLAYSYAAVHERWVAKVRAAERSTARRDREVDAALSRAVSINMVDHSFDPHGYFVYLLWGDEEAQPLYVGQSTNVLGRLGQHMQAEDRRHRVRRVQVLRCRGKVDMDRTERRLIALYQPPLNIVGVVR
jgi:hypothetical protein